MKGLPGAGPFDDPSGVPGIIAKPKLDPEESKRRKLQVVFDGFLQYYPRATKEVANYSRLGNDKHNPGQPLHWAKEKSQDQANCAGRHLIDIGPDWMARDPEFNTFHAVGLAWRSMALLETVLEAEERGISVVELQKLWKEEAKK